MSELQDVGRLAFRVQGKIWRCFWCPNQNNMKGKVELGAIRMSLVPPGSERKQEFIDLMQDCFNDMLKETLGTDAYFPGPEPAPESERSGHA